MRSSPLYIIFSASPPPPTPLQGGVALAGAARERFNAIQQELSKLGTDFSNNLLDATKVRGGKMR